MRRASVAFLVTVLTFTGFAFAVLAASPAEGGRHWAHAPLLAFAIVGAMGGLVAVASARLGSLK